MSLSAIILQIYSFLDSIYQIVSQLKIKFSRAILKFVISTFRTRIGLVTIILEFFLLTPSVKYGTFRLENSVYFNRFSLGGILREGGWRVIDMKTFYCM